MPRSSASLPNLESYDLESGYNEKGERRETLKVRKTAKIIGINVWFLETNNISWGGEQLAHILFPKLYKNCLEPIFKKIF